MEIHSDYQKEENKMPFFNNENISIAAMACAVPDNLVTVDSFSNVFGQEVTDRFTDGTGIKQMYKALPEQTAGDIAYAAAENLMEHYPVDKDKIGALILVTQSPDYRRPATACVLQKRLGLSKDCAVMDIGLGCSGFVYGLQVAGSLMASSDMEYALLLIGETASKLVNPQDKSIVMMYGDAGAAVLLKREPESNIKTLLRSDGSKYEAIVLPAGGFRDMNPSHETFMCSDGNERSLYDIFMDGTAVFSFSINEIPVAIKDYLEVVGKNIEEFDVIALHQANKFILKQITKRIKAKTEKVPLSLDRYGNTGGISIPLTLCDKYGSTDEEVIKVLASGFGIGLSWGVTSFEIDTTNIYPVILTSDYYAEGKFMPGEY